MKKLEPVLYLVLIGGLTAALLVEGRRFASLQQQLPMSAKELYRTLTKTQTRLQVLDVRADLASGYEDTHIPGAIPFPDCALEKTPKTAQGRILPYVPTVIVSGDGAQGAFERCRAQFAFARNLAQGVDGWVEAGLPEDSGEYMPPRSSAGGGCL